MVPDFQLMVEIFKIGIVELPSIIQNDDPWNSETTNDVFPDKAPDFCFHNLGKGFASTYLVK